VTSLTAIENIQTKNLPTHPCGTVGDFQHPEPGEREPSKENEPANPHGLADEETPEVIAHSVEFVAWPGTAEELRRVLPEAMRGAFAGCVNFSGSLVLFPEQESRLVTVVTLWKGEGRTNQRQENSKRVEQLLFPYIEQCLRMRKLAAFLSMR